jgi:uroporphyrin-III C-methyltransferase/precorrin-2 dehydrogenase/sirohydrochlorin ferrochelatase
VTGHAKLGQTPDLDWDALARGNQTVVVYMGVGTAGTIAARLIAAGRESATPVAVIENGTRAQEIRAFGVLGELSEIIVRAGIQGPALLVIGEVVRVARDAQAMIPAEHGKSREPSDHESARGEMGPGSALRSARDNASRPTLSDLWRMFS